MLNNLVLEKPLSFCGKNVIGKKELDVYHENNYGRPPTTTAHQDRKIVQSVQTKLITTAKEVAGMYDFIKSLMDQNYCIFVPLDVASLDVSSSTVIRTLAKAGLKPEEWPRPVIFSDEKKNWVCRII